MSRSDVLIVEADDLYADVLHRLLLGNRFTCEITGSAIEAVAILAREDFRCIVISNNLPDAAAVRLMTTIRSNSSIRVLNRRIPVVIVLEEPSSSLTISTLDAGADDCLAKPFSPAEFSARVRRMVRQALDVDDDLPGDV